MVFKKRKFSDTNERIARYLMFKVNYTGEWGITMDDNPKLIEGSLFVDGRGELGFVNDFNMSPIKRFYTVTNHQVGFVRAWHGHKNEAKYVMVVDGVAMIGIVKIDDFDDPSYIVPDIYILSSKKPAILYIPPGYANGFKTLTVDTKLIFFSTCTLKESKDDDYRWSKDKWDCWEIKER